MIKKLRRAFTIVELVIVIAVIAVLAAVLIPTFSNIINKSQISADQTNVTNLNKQISIELVDGKIESAEDLERAIVKVFGQEYYDNLAPKSAKLGYNYWFNTKTNLVELKKYDESFVSERANLSMTTKSFDENNFRRYGDYYLLDQAGSNFADVIKSLETLRSADDYNNAITLVNDILSNENNHHYVQTNTLIDKLYKTVIIGNAGTFRYADYINVTNVLFVGGITTINSNLYLYDGTNVISTISSQTNPIANVSEITLPSTIRSVEGNALYFKENKTVNIYGSFKTIDEVKAIFKAYSTNGIIVCEESEGLVLNGSKLEDLSGNEQGSLDYSNPVASFDILYTENDKIKYIDKLYVAYDLGSFQLVVDNFVGEDLNSIISTEEVSWSTSNEGLTIDNNGLVTINDSDVTEFTITATAAGGHEETINVAIVKVVGATVTIGGSSIDAENNLTITYNGNNSEHDITTAITYTYTGVVDLDDDITCETNGDIFSIVKGEDGKYKLVLKEWDNSVDLSKQQTFTISIGEYEDIEVSVKVIDNSAKTFETKFTNDYLYRVGNGNAIKLSSLFTSEKPGDNITLTIYDAKMSTTDRSEISTTSGFKATYTKTLNSENWENSTIDFDGIGVAIIVIENSKGTCEVAVEVINGTNITGTLSADKEYYGISSLGSGNQILLNDVKFTGTTYLSMSNATLYGNGYSLDVTNAAHQLPSGSGVYANLLLTNANIDNTKVIAAVYAGVGATQAAEYFSAAVRTVGNCSITNSYLSNARVPLRVDGDTLVENTVLDGGSFGNLELRTGELTLKDVTTINTVRDDSYGKGKKIMGFGIVIYDGASSGKIKIEGALKQYNWVGKNTHSQYFNSGDLKTAFDLVFSEGSANMYYTYNGDKYINTGILCLSETFSMNNVTNMANYINKNVSYSVFTGWIMSFDMTNSSNQTFFGEKDNAPTEFINSDATIYQPTFNFSLNTNDIISKEEDVDDDRYCIYEDGIIYIKSLSNAERVSITLENQLSVSKYTGQTFGVNVKCVDSLGNELTITSGKVTFETAGKYTIVYTITDNLFFDKEGRIKENSIDYTYEIPVDVSIAKVEQKNAEITFAGSTSAKVAYSGWTLIFTSDYDYYYCAPIFDIQITDYDENNNSVTTNGADFIKSSLVFEKIDSNGSDVKITVQYEGGRTLEIRVKVPDQQYSGAHDVSGIYSYNNKYYFVKGKSNLFSAAAVTISYTFTGYNGNKLSDIETATVSWAGKNDSNTATADFKFDKMTSVAQ